MTKSLKNRVRKLEQHTGKDRGWAIIMVEPGETKEQAKEKHLAQHPEDKDCPGFIIMDCSSRVPEPECQDYSPATEEQELKKKKPTPICITR